MFECDTENQIISERLTFGMFGVFLMRVFYFLLIYCREDADIRFKT